MNLFSHLKYFGSTYSVSGNVYSLPLRSCIGSYLQLLPTAREQPRNDG